MNYTEGNFAGRAKKMVKEKAAASLGVEEVGYLGRANLTIGGEELSLNIAPCLVIGTNEPKDLIWRLHPEIFGEIPRGINGVLINKDNDKDEVSVRYGEDEFRLHLRASPEIYERGEAEITEMLLMLQGLVLYPNRLIKEKGLIVSALQVDGTVAMALPGEVLADYKGDEFPLVKDRDDLYLISLPYVTEKELNVIKNIFENIIPVGVILGDVEGLKFTNVKEKMRALWVRCDYCDGNNDVTEAVKEYEEDYKRYREVGEVISCGSCSAPLDMFGGEEQFDWK